MNINEIINEAADRINEPSISDITSTTNNQAKMYFSSAKKMARDIAKRYQWQAITNIKSFLTISEVQEYRLPDDYKELVTNYLYNNTRQWYIQKETPDIATAYVTSGGSSWSTANFRLINNRIRFTVPASSEDEIIYEYKSKYLSLLDCQEEETFTSNESEFLLDDEALIKGIVFDVSRKYGFDNAIVLKQEYEEEIADLIEKDGGKFVINTHSGLVNPLPRGWSFENDC
jgi:cytochrome b involved in lipid metabolism